MTCNFKFIFAKDADMIYISHLDLMRLLSRAARRADIPVELTHGFNPHFQIKLKRALKLGVPSAHEELEIILRRDIEGLELMKMWQKELPDGIKILEVKRDPFDKLRVILRD